MFWVPVALPVQSTLGEDDHPIISSLMDWMWRSSNLFETRAVEKTHALASGCDSSFYAYLYYDHFR
jgi:hypothetical protein